MGFIDYRCSVSGLSLLGERAVQLCVLEVEPGKWAPISLPMFGTYDRYGKIDDVKADFRTAFLASDIHTLAKNGRLVGLGNDSLKLLAEFKAHSQPPPIQKVISLIERATTTTSATYNFDAITLDGKDLRQTLILRELYDAAVGTGGAKPKQEPPGPAVKALIDQTFETEAGRWMMRDLPKTLAATRIAAFAALSGLLAFRQWLDGRKLAWQPSCDSAQHCSIHGLAFYPAARARFRDDKKVLKVVDAHARRIEEVEAEDRFYGLPDQWLRSSASSWYGLAAGTTRVGATEPATLRKAIEQHIAAASAQTLLAAGPEVLVVQRGVVEKRIDLRPLIRISAGGEQRTLADPAVGTLVEASAAVAINWDEIELQLAPLEEPLAQGEAALFPLMLNGGTAPAWAQKDEDYRDSIVRFTLG